MRSCIVHSLPVAANFVGRRAELDELCRRLLEPESPVRTVSLVGIGGAGKTALAAEFLRSLPSNPQRPDLLFVWSFYVDQDPNSFLAAAHSFVTEGVAAARAARAGAGALHSLTDALGGLDRRVVLVLDGLERVQIPRDHRRRGYGTLEDALLRRALIRLTCGVGRARVLITTRFVPTDLSPWDRSTHLPLDIIQLDHEAARDLLRRRGVRAPAGDDGPLDLLIDEFGRHALTLDHLGGFIASLRGGDPASPPPRLPGAASPLGMNDADADADAASRAPVPKAARASAESTLIRVLSAYARGLPPAEVSLLQRLCLYRFGATPQRLFDTFARHKSPQLAGALHQITRASFDEALRSLVERHLVFAEGDGSYGTHPAIRDFFYSLFTNPASFHAAVAWGLADARVDAAWHEVAMALAGYRFVRMVDDPNAAPMFARELLAVVDRLRPHLGNDAHAVLARFARGVAAGERPEVPRMPNRVITLSGKPGQAYPEDKATLDLIEELIYHALQAGHWSAGRHMYEHRLGGREHLGKRLGEFARGERIVAALCATPDELARMDTGTQRPPSPTSPRARARGAVDESIVLDRAWYLRGLGDLNRAFHHFTKARRIWAGTVLVLSGFLIDAARGSHYWRQTRDVAELLMGHRGGGYKPIWVGWGEAVTDGEVALLYDRRTEARALAQPWLRDGGGTLSAEVSRSRLVLAEAALRDRRIGEAAEHLDAAEPWIQHSGSVEHQILLLAARMRLADGEGNRPAADACYTEALVLARRSGFGLYHIDLLNARAAALLARDARAHAGEAALLAAAALNGLTTGDETPPSRADLALDELLIHGALHPRCCYAWGEAAARVIAGRSALITGSARVAVDELARAELIYHQLQAPQLAETRKLLGAARRQGAS